jgi:hypothetical protein
MSDNGYAGAKGVSSDEILTRGDVQHNTNMTPR